MNRPRLVLMLWLAGLAVMASIAGGYPKPSPYPITWELNFEHSQPKRIVVRPKGSQEMQAFWYMTYTITNLSDQEQTFLPHFELLTEDGKVIRSDKDIPSEVLGTIRILEKAPALESAIQIAGPIRVGEDQAKEGVAIWREPEPRMGQFTVFVGGLSGEAVILRDDKGQPAMQAGPDGAKRPVVLHKTLQLDYHMPGDDRYPGTDAVRLDGQRWIMR